MVWTEAHCPQGGMGGPHEGFDAGQRRWEFVKSRPVSPGSVFLPSSGCAPVDLKKMPNARVVS